MRRFFNIEKWTYRELLIFLLVFLISNLFAPRGFVQWVLIQQDIRRVKNEMGQTRERTLALEEELRIFQRSDLIKAQKLRELGYLKTSELSLEFVDSTHKSAKRELPLSNESASLSSDAKELSR